MALRHEHSAYISESSLYYFEYVEKDRQIQSWVESILGLLNLFGLVNNMLQYLSYCDKVFDMNTRVDLIREALSEAERALADAEEAVRIAEQRATPLRAEVEGLRNALAAHESTSKEPRENRSVGGIRILDDPGRWKIFPRTDAVEKVLREQGRGVHRKELTKLLHAKGRDDALNDVSAALAYLNRVGRVKSEGLGYWSLAEHQPSAGGDA